MFCLNANARYNAFSTSENFSGNFCDVRNCVYIADAKGGNVAARKAPHGGGIGMTHELKTFDGVLIDLDLSLCKEHSRNRDYITYYLTSLNGFEDYTVEVCYDVDTVVDFKGMDVRGYLPHQDTCRGLEIEEEHYSGRKPYFLLDDNEYSEVPLNELPITYIAVYTPGPEPELIAEKEVYND